MKLGLACVGILVFSGPAAAQQTDCYRVGQMVRCNTTQPIQPPPPIQNVDAGGMIDAYRDGQADREAARPRGVVQVDTPASDLAAEWARMAVAEHLKGGRCTEAINAALDAGEIELATQAKAFCAMPSPPE